MRVRPMLPDNSLFCADACTAKVQTAISAPMVRFFSDIFLLLKSSVRCYASSAWSSFSNFRVTTVVRLPAEYDPSSATVLLRYLMQNRSIMLTEPTTRQRQTECGPQFLPSRWPGNAG